MKELASIPDLQKGHVIIIDHEGLLIYTEQVELCPPKADRKPIQPKYTS